jgi:hypothetical protein
MLSIIFDDLRKRYPALREAFDALEGWWELHQRKSRHFEPQRIATWRDSVDAFDLSTALNIMVREGILQRAYGVRGPDRTLATEGFFDSPDEIPERLHGTGDDEFEKSAGDIIPVYREVVTQ